MIATPRRRLLLAPSALLLAAALAGPTAVAAPAPKASKPATPSAAPAKPAAAAATPAAATPTRPTQTPAAEPAQSGPLLGEDPATSARTSDLYGDRLDGMTGEVNALKDKIFRSKARLAVLRDTVMSGVAAGSRVVIAHRNLMGVGFRLVRLVFTLDGAQIFARSDDSGALDQEDEILIFDGSLPPGPHEARIELTYQGQGYGVFNYLRGYTFKSPQNHSFIVSEGGGQFKLVSKGYERGNITTEMKDRPAVEFQTVGLDGEARGVTAAPAPAASTPAAAAPAASAPASK